MPEDQTEISKLYEALEVIGRGSFGTIRKVRRISDGQLLVRKEIFYSKMTEKEKDQLQAEIRVLQELKHPNIVQYVHHDHLRQSRTLHIYMEYCDNGDLGALIKKCRHDKTMVPEHAVWSILIQLVLALYRCHNGIDPPAVGDLWSTQASDTLPLYAPGEVAKRVLHRDLKPDNVFLMRDNDVKLGDFGLAKLLAPEQQLANTYVGTPYYMSPEIVSDQPYTHKSDIWSLGCLIYELCCLAPPFNAKTQWSLIEKIKEGKYESLPREYTPELRHVVDQCLRVDHRRRPATADLLAMSHLRLCRRERDAVVLCRAVKYREELLGQKEQQIRAQTAEYVKNMEKRHAELRTTLEREIDGAFRAKWEAFAEAEMQKQVEHQTQLRVEAEIAARLEGEVQARLEQELQRRMDAMNLELARTADAASASYSSSSGASSSGPAQTPARTFFSTAVESPADIMMASPMVLATPAPAVALREPLHAMPPPNRPPLFAQASEPPAAVSALASFFAAPASPPLLPRDAGGFGFIPPPPPPSQAGRAQMLAAALDTGSPVKARARGGRRAGLARAGTEGSLQLGTRGSMPVLRGKENLFAVAPKRSSPPTSLLEVKNRSLEMAPPAVYNPQDPNAPSPYKKAHVPRE